MNDFLHNPNSTGDHVGELLTFDDEGEVHWYCPKELLKIKIEKAKKDIAELDINSLSSAGINVWLAKLGSF